jgi:hypothetical protein
VNIGNEISLAIGINRGSSTIIYRSHTGIDLFETSMLFRHKENLSQTEPLFTHKADYPKTTLLSSLDKQVTTTKKRISQEIPNKSLESRYD